MDINIQNIIPMNNRVSIKIIKHNNNSKFYTPIKEEDVCLGEIISVGSGITELSQGNRVLFSQFSATKIKTNNDEIFIINIDKIIAKER